MINVLPRILAKALIERYEYYDIGLDKNIQFFQFKNTILEKKIVSMRDFSSFVDRTKGISYTFFNYHHSIYDKLLNIVHKSREKKTLVMSDVKFRRIQYVRFLGFNDEYYKKVKEIIETSTNKELILDLRDNTGGKFESCLKIIDLLVPKEKILTVERKSGSKDYYTDDNFKSFEKIYILLNENTASCSEILCMVLKKKLENVFLIGDKRCYKKYTQHVIYNKFFGYRFAIADGIWSVDGEIADDLQPYLRFSERKMEVLGDFLECIKECETNPVKSA